MTTYTQFTPSSTSTPPFQFTATLDDAEYTITVTWNLYRQSWYLNVYALDGTREFTGPLIGSPTGTDITCTPGIFTDAVIYRADSNNFETP